MLVIVMPVSSGAKLIVFASAFALAAFNASRSEQPKFLQTPVIVILSGVDGEVRTELVFL